MHKNILLFGAGKSATTLIDYLLKQTEIFDWKLVVADANIAAIELKTGKHTNSQAVEADINNEAQRQSLIAKADIVISMMPPHLHILVAKDCVALGKSLLTASYMDEGIKGFDEMAKQKGIVLLCEMGLDPGIDHMSAMKLFDEIKAQGGKITSFKSHCGGLVAPESDNNPWRYKISWNPRNVVLAGKAGALFIENFEEKNIGYNQIFSTGHTVGTGNEIIGNLSTYPNRNSLPYQEIYDLKNCKDFVRTTLRYPAFMHGWQKIVELNLTDETPAYETANMSLKAFFSEHFEKNKVQNLSAFDEDFKNQLEYFGLNDNETLINKGFCSAADVMQFVLEKKLALSPNDKDMIVMIHEIGYELNDKQHFVVSKLIIEGENSLHTAMSKTVGLPLGIAAKLILNNELKLSGALIPTTKEIYEPVLKELGAFGISFEEAYH